MHFDTTLSTLDFARAKRIVRYAPIAPHRATSIDEDSLLALYQRAITAASEAQTLRDEDAGRGLADFVAKGASVSNRRDAQEVLRVHCTYFQRRFTKSQPHQPTLHEA